MRRLSGLGINKGKGKKHTECQREGAARNKRDIAGEDIINRPIHSTPSRSTGRGGMKDMIGRQGDRKEAGRKRGKLNNYKGGKLCKRV